MSPLEVVHAGKRRIKDKVKILDTKQGDAVWQGNFDILLELMVAQMLNDAALR